MTNDELKIQEQNSPVDEEHQREARKGRTITNELTKLT